MGLIEIETEPVLVLETHSSETSQSKKSMPHFFSNGVANSLSTRPDCLDLNPNLPVYQRCDFVQVTHLFVPSSPQL